MQLEGENMLTTFDTLFAGDQFKTREDDMETLIKILVFRNVREIGGLHCCVDVNVVAITGFMRYKLEGTALFDLPNGTQDITPFNTTLSVKDTDDPLTKSKEYILLLKKGKGKLRSVTATLSKTIRTINFRVEPGTTDEQEHWSGY